MASTDLDAATRESLAAAGGVDDPRSSNAHALGETNRENFFRRVRADGDHQAIGVHLQSWKLLLEELEAGKVWSSGDNLQGTPFEDLLDCQHNRQIAFTKRDTVAPAEQQTQVRASEHRMLLPVDDAMVIEGRTGAADPGAHRTRWSG